MNIQEKIEAISKLDEVWRPCPGFEEKYLVSSHGRVMGIGTYNTCKKGELLKLHRKHGRNGYIQVQLFDSGKRKTIEIQSLVAKAFLPNPDNLPMVNHKDEDKTNNYVCINSDGSVDYEKSNLEWCTNQYNVRYSNAKAVDVYTKDGIFVETLEAVIDAANKYNTDTSNIQRCLKSAYGLCKGHQFRYHGEPFQRKPISIKQKKRAERARHDSNESRYVTLYEYTIDGTFVTAWPNSQAASRALGIEGTNIRKCAKGKITTIGGKIFLRAGETIEERLCRVINRKHKSKSENVR